MEYSAAKILNDFKTQNNGFWQKLRQKKCLDLFHAAAKSVPAYKDFLKKNSVSPAKIKTFADFQLVPPVSKANYLRQYEFKDLLWPKALSEQLVFTSTSGSTGEPFYFPRTETLDWQMSVMVEEYLSNASAKIHGPILVIIGFGMGVWIGGTITFRAFELAAQRRSAPVSIITPGINKSEIFHALKKLAPNFSQTVFIGYAPFVKDVVDEAVELGINLKKLNLRLMFAAESFTEHFRDYLVKKAGVADSRLDTLNIYGTADLGATGYETPLSILIRQLAVKDRKLFNGLFNSVAKMPTLAQYNPHFVNIEAPEGNVLLTGNNAMPLVRYAIGDNGGEMSAADMASVLKSRGIDLAREAKSASVLLNHMPFVFIHERNDFMVKLHMHEIHPQTIKEALIKPKVRDFLTGKFSMTTKYNSNQNQYLELNLELKKGTEANALIGKLVEEAVLQAMKLNAKGPGNTGDLIKRKDLVKILFWEHEHPTYFKAGVKQKWVIK